MSHMVLRTELIGIEGWWRKDRQTYRHRQRHTETWIYWSAGIRWFGISSLCFLSFLFFSSSRQTEFFCETVLTVLISWNSLCSLCRPVSASQVLQLKVCATTGRFEPLLLGWSRIFYGETKAPWKFCMTIAWSWRDKQDYCIQLNKRAGLLHGDDQEGRVV